MKYYLVALLALAASCKARNNGNQSADTSTQPSMKADLMPVVNSADYELPRGAEPASVVSHRISGDSLYVKVSYSGGCAEHSFLLYANGMYMKSLPLQLPVKLLHLPVEDNCRQLVEQELVFHLLPLRASNDKADRMFLLLGQEKIEYIYPK
jgi:hypothetical protein